MIVVTGGSGFIGSNLVRALAADGIEVVVVDDADPARNLAGVAIAEHVGQQEFLDRVARPGGLAGVEAVLHQGACSSTTEDDEAFLTANNHLYSRSLLAACLGSSVPLVYASSAAVYGPGPVFEESPANDRPLNGYARSKAAFDADVRAALPAGSQVVGLRYFNVYGPGERHKAEMASQVLQLTDEVLARGTATIFGAGEGAAAGAHERDFVHVDDVVAVVRWFLDHPDRSGIFNCGTGVARTFGDLARAVVTSLGTGTIGYRPFPDSLRGRYQSHTQADLSHLRAAGCDHRFATLEDGVARYVAVLSAPARPGGGGAGDRSSGS